MLYSYNILHSCVSNISVLLLTMHYNKPSLSHFTALQGWVGAYEESWVGTYEESWVGARKKAGWGPTKKAGWGPIVTGESLASRSV